MFLLHLFNSVVIGPSSVLTILVPRIFGTIALPALVPRGLEGIQLQGKLMKLVSSLKRALSLENCLLHVESQRKEGSVYPGWLQVQRYMLLEHIDPVDELVDGLATPWADALIVSEYILRADVIRA